VLERCSPDGWCVTDLPADDLDLRDIRPFEDRAFAVAESPSLGIQFLEWERSTDKWKFINEGSQNRFDRGAYAGNMWAPNENEVYFTLAPAFVYHGVRANPASPFTWKISRLDAPGPGLPPVDGGLPADDAGLPAGDAGPDAGDGGLPATEAGLPAHDPGKVWMYNERAEVPFAPSLGVEGMPWGDVFAWYGPTLFRRTVANDGEDGWVVEHVLTDPEYREDHFHIQSIAGGAPDDLWIGGVRSRVYPDGVRERACPVAVQRRADGYHHLVDHVVMPPGGSLSLGCDAKPGSPQFTQRFEVPGTDFVIEFAGASPGWLRSLQHIAPNTVVGIMGPSVFVYLTSDGEVPLARVNDVGFASDVGKGDTASVWTTSDGAWMSGYGYVLSLDYDPTNWSRGVGLFDPSAASGDDACRIMQCGTYKLSSIARGGYPHKQRLNQVRGTSVSNVWAVGDRHALHKKPANTQ